MKALLTGWFSFEDMGATAGDLISRDLVVGWLEEAGWQVEVALVPPFPGGVDWRSVDPAGLDLVVFVCGPFGNGEPLPPFLERFAGIPFAGINLTMLEPLDAWNPFDLLLERDSSRRSNPDLAFAGPPPTTPVVGLVRIHPQPEYRERDLHVRANAALERLVAVRQVAVVPIDTRLDVPNAGGLRTADEIEALVSRMDVVLTTRLHGLVLALKNGVPALAVDPVAGGAKIGRQAAALRWGPVFPADASDEELVQAFDWCLTPAARARAAAAGDLARDQLRRLRGELDPFLATLALGDGRRPG